MAYSSVWGFGGVRIYATNDASPAMYLSSGIGNLTYTPQWQKATNWKNKNISKFLGYKVQAEVDLMNIKSADHIQFQNLMVILSKMRDSDMTVYPRWVPNLAGYVPTRIGYNDFILTSDVELIEGNLLEKFQTINLKFEKRALVDSIPASISYALYTGWSVSNEGSIDTITDENGIPIDFQVF